MKNFNKAKQIISDYHKLRLFPEAKNAFRLHEKLAETGYTVQEFMDDKDDETIKELNIEIREIDSFNVLSEVQNGFSGDRNICLIITQDNPVVYVGSNDFNEGYCVDNNILINKIGYSGGTIISGKEDITLGIILENPNMMDYFRRKLKKWIEENSITTEIIGNDLMVGNNKVVGTAIKQTGNKTLYCIQISFSVDLDLIQKISKKKIIKIPKGLNCFINKKKEDLVKEIKIWLQQ